jgi:beta-glucosidase/6-phospho-beta-glucosidase/beta-galactosidase
VAESFLDIINRAGLNTDGDAYGGARGTDGDGLPTGNSNNFMFATGIECSDPTVGDDHFRRDQLAECGHYEHWRQDFELVQGLGLKFLRYGLSYHNVHLGPGRYDWSFPDQALGELKRLGITPILDLMHFGLPGWLGDFQNPALPRYFAEYAGAVARRYPWVRYYTPVNEIYITARSSGLDGAWNERLKTPAGFVTALKHAAAASILACQAIVKERPDAVIIQSESAEHLHDVSVKPRAEITLKNQLAHASLDLLYAVPPTADVMMYLLDGGMTRDEFEWFMLGEPPGHQIVGNDYYGRNERMVMPGGELIVAEDVLGWRELARRFHHRYHKPVMHTETNSFDPETNVAWLWKQWVNVLQLRREDVPVVGFTWYSLTDQIDWDTGLVERNGRVNPVGLYDLNRKVRPVGDAYRELIKNFGQITLLPHGEMFDLTQRPASLKVEV